MTQPTFEINILRQHWIKDDGKIDLSDLCSHGELFIKIGNSILSNSEDGSWTLTACGLFLMRSLGQNCDIDEFDNYMAPCCGHFLIPDDEKNYVKIDGCNSGVDWKTEHENGFVRITSEKGDVAELPFEDYKKIVSTFICQVEDFYGDPKIKKLPKEKFDQDGFNQFWTEWHLLKRKWDI